MDEPGLNGHHEDRTGAERVRSGFDRRRNWGDSIENVYRRIDHRLTELAQEEEEVPQETTAYWDRHPRQIFALFFIGGWLLGFLNGRFHGKR